ncbi:L-alanine-DL-glutamate epimerase [Lentibacillus halodurans]|uniref:Dipeptide epimerase n=1 Tax=Lentibacillus halodurans TaxID=237679 RepID=A0A1I0YDH1_9BACI|nr:dipeptide epimerase [Lentibacillus halodurans]SFB11429.1 L-alanine-DL-glutamate epimerase [Lentibacillus halodurans]
MKITELQTQRSSMPLEKTFKTALREVTEIEVIDVMIRLENGEAGFGSAASTWQITGESLASIQAAIEGPIKSLILNQDIEELEDILTKVERSCAGNTSAKAAVDIALHDVYCRLFQLPLHQYLGGGSDFPETDMTISINAPDVMQTDARHRVKQGFNVLKIKVGNNEQTDISRIQKIREAVGSDVQLRLDANQGWKPKQAVKIIRYLEENAGVELVEQPVPAHDFEGLKYIRERVDTPIMADESVFTPFDAFRLISMGAVDLLNIKLMKSGGIRRARQIADTAQSAGIECMIGSMMESNFSITAAAHLAYAHRNITYYDLDAALWLKEQAADKAITWRGRTAELSNKPGLGFS